MSFYRWIIKNHVKDHTSVGDLARDIKGDSTFPHDGNKETLEFYLESCGACSGCMDAFEETWSEYAGENS